ncbi:MAG: hypothetical protein PHX13_07780 [Thiovulaceae bacterium]|nr:hypothetical protein [Sulfurimonadaceae bacterium]
MLRLVLGGVALATAGYGLKRYCDENNGQFDLCKLTRKNIFVDLIDKFQHHNENPKNILEEYESVKYSLHVTTLKEVNLALSEITNIGRTIEFPSFESDDDKYNQLALTDENSKKIGEFIVILQKAQEHLNMKLDSLDTLLARSNDYSTYSEKERNCLQHIILLNDRIYDIIQLPISFDSVTINRTLKRIFEKIGKDIIS